MPKVSDFLIRRLAEWGVDRIYGYPGDGINGIMGAFGRAGDDGPQFVQVRHEEMAAFMACGHAKFTGEVRRLPGDVRAGRDPSAERPVRRESMDHQPVVAIVGQQARSALGGDYQQEVDLQTLFKDVAREYLQMASSPDQMRHLVDRAMRIAHRRAHGHVPDRAQRRAGAGRRRDAAARARHGALGPRVHARRRSFRRTTTCGERRRS